VDLGEASAERLGVGRFAPAITIAGDEPAGLHEIRYFWRFDDGPERRARKHFDVIAGGTGPLGFGPSYALISALRAEGVPATGSGAVSDLRLLTTLVLASQYIDVITGRRFGPYFAEQVQIDTTLVQDDDDGVDPTTYRVFNRHLRGMISPDDRENPKIEFIHGDDALGAGRDFSGTRRGLFEFLWPSGVQNIHVHGAFGYTDPDGSPWGEVPGLICQAAKLLVMREMCLFWDLDCREDWQRRWRLTGERTRDQSYTLADPRKWGGLTGDPEIDMILTRYMRPPMFGAA
jgi:hypothetical protein